VASLGRRVTDRAPSRQRRWIGPTIGIAITVICLVVFVRQINVAEALEALEHFSWPYLFVAVASLAVGYALRVLRWTTLLKASGAKVTFAQCVAPFLGSITLNNVLPLRVGDIVRALVFPQSMAISRTVATSSLVMERLIDLMTLLVCFAIGIFALRTVVVPSELAASALGLATVGAVVLIAGLSLSGPLGRLFQAQSDRRRGAGARILQTIGALFIGFNAMSGPKTLIVVALISMCVWVAEAGLFYFVLLGASVPASPIVGLLVMSVATLATLVPSSPGYVGPFHLAAFTAVSLVGGTSAQAGSYAVIVHLALWIPTTVAGAVAIWMRPKLFETVRGAGNVDAAKDIAS
jgi:glycosyltransferase 2 family protein